MRLAYTFLGWVFLGTAVFEALKIIFPGTLAQPPDALSFFWMPVAVLFSALSFHWSNGGKPQ